MFVNSEALQNERSTIILLIIISKSMFQQWINKQKVPSINELPPIKNAYIILFANVIFR